MPPQVQKLLSRHRVCSLTIVLQDGNPHAAAMHYSHREKPLELFFSTDKSSKKCEGLLDGSSVKASVVIGFSEEEFATLQLDGYVRTIVQSSELLQIQSLHYAKHPDAEQYKDDPDTLFLKFTPAWWRYSDYKTSPTMILSSD